MRRDKKKDKDSTGHPDAQSALHMENHRSLVATLPTLRPVGRQLDTP